MTMPYMAYCREEVGLNKCNVIPILPVITVHTTI